MSDLFVSSDGRFPGAPNPPTDERKMGLSTGILWCPAGSFLNALWNQSLSRAVRDSYFVAWLGRLGLRCRKLNHELVREAYMNFSGVSRHLLDDWAYILDWASKGVAFGGI